VCIPMICTKKSCFQNSLRLRMAALPSGPTDVGEKPDAFPRSNFHSHARYRYIEDEVVSRSKYSRSISDSIRFFKSGGFTGNLS